MKIPKLALLPKILISICAGILCGFFFPESLTRVFITVNNLFGNFLGFIIPLLILGLIAPSISELGKGAGRLLLLTAALAYGFTVFTGFFTFFTCKGIYPWLLEEAGTLPGIGRQAMSFQPYFRIEMPPLMGVMTALILAFTLGLGMASIPGERMHGIMSELRDIIYKVISHVIIPLLPLYIFGIFLNTTQSGQVAGIMHVFLKIIVVIFILTVVLLLVQFSIAGILDKKNPFRLFRNMLPAYMTALGTQSSAASIPITLGQTVKNGVRQEVAGFVIPLCATIHLSGSMMKISACALAILLMTGGEVGTAQFSGFILMLAIAMIAAPGVPGGGIMASLGLLQSMLGFDETAQGLMIALYIAMDSFGTATNVTGDGAIAVIMNRLYRN